MCFIGGTGIVEVSGKPNLPEEDPCYGQDRENWDLATGNWAAYLDGDTFPVDEVPYRVWSKFRM